MNKPHLLSRPFLSKLTPEPALGMALSGFLLACALLFSGGCSRVTAPTSATPSNQPTEQRWIIGAIAKDLANLTAFAADAEHWKSLPTSAVEVHETAADVGAEPGQNYSLSISLPGGEPVKSDLKITRSVWAPELYAPTVRALFARMKISPPNAGSGPEEVQPDADLLKALANPLTATMEAQNRQISDWLQKHPLDAGAHQQAALLLGALAMRENSGLFWNPRGICNRAVAHLAFARALRPEVSESGEVAELLIGLIIDTKADCQKRIAALQPRVATHPELGPWVMAAALRNTRDYRLLAKPDGATLLERLELFRAYSDAIGAEQAIARMGAREPSAAPDWSRIILQAGYGVSSGHQFAIPSIGQEITDAAQIFPALRTARTPDQFAAIFNQEPGEAVQLDEKQAARCRVIDQGLWAQFCQRHALHAADETYNFLHDKWGVPDEARAFRVQVGSLLKRLTLFPLCLEHLGYEDRAGLYPQAANLLTQHPEWVGDKAWAKTVTNVSPQLTKDNSWLAVSGAWFSPAVPTGTAYGFYWRLDKGGIVPALSLPELKKMHDIAPLQYDVCRLYLNASAPDHHVTPARFKEVMAPLLPYYLPALRGESTIMEIKNDPAQYGAVMNQTAALEPVYYTYLGEYYLEHKMEPEAAQAYQAAIDHEADPVTVSNSCGWLVGYYYDHNQKERAMTIAKEVAETYSFKGLETMAGLLERMDRLPEAESYYKKIEERYESAKPLHFFYLRHATNHPAYAEQIKGMESEVFPTGMQTITLAQLTGKPTKGILIHGENELSRKCGLKSDAIILAIDGKRVRDVNQYTYVRSLSDSPDFELLVYQDNHYQAIHASAPNRTLGLQISSWP